MGMHSARRSAAPSITTASGSKPVLLGTEEIGFAASWEEVRVVLGLAGWKVKPSEFAPGVEGPRAYHIDRVAIERIPDEGGR